jgi:hypothetical protein
MVRSRVVFDLFLVSGLILFLELACIRWFPAHVIFLSFFTNTVLLVSFVGMSVGCLIARKPVDHIRATPYWLAAALGCGLLVEQFHQKLQRHLDVGNQANPDVVFFGAETSALRPVEFVVPVEVMAGLFYFLVAAAMIGPGQELGRAFNRVGGRAKAYSCNLLGSLVGILAFAGCSELSLPPVVWFTAVALGVGYLLLRSVPGSLRLVRLPLAALAGVVALSAATSGLVDRGGSTTWSPYYRVTITWPDGIINTNLMSHQVMTSREGVSAVAYDLPYLFARDTNRPPFERILIIGAGSGNDLSRALSWSPPSARIDAVEIDPAIRSIGGELHPDQPYSDPRVTTHLTDGRTFLRTAPAGEYDLVVFALVDSLVLHSSASSIRLESYLFTTESFADVARVLKPAGQVAVYNFFRHGWIVARLRDALRTAFGTDPVVLTDPPSDRVSLSKFDSAFTAFFAGRPEAIAPLRAKFASGESFWVPGHRPAALEVHARFGTETPPPLPPPSEWVRLRAAVVEESGGSLIPATDDWPFLYVRQPAIPAPTWRGVALIVALSLAVWWLYRDRSGRISLPPDAGPADANGAGSAWGDRGDRGLLVRSFFLGAGFMLIETRAVVEMALLFGSTWVVNTVVFAAVLVMALAGNLYAAWRKPTTLWPYYLGLAVALGIGYLVPSSQFLDWPRAAQIGASCLIGFAPLAFAGVIFATSFSRSADPSRMIGANVAGALVGGLVENASMLIGFRGLLLLAGGFYLVSGLVGRARGSLTGPGGRYNDDGVWSGRTSWSDRLVNREPGPTSSTENPPNAGESPVRLDRIVHD